MHTRTCCLLCLAAAALLTRPAQAGLIVGNDQTNPSLWEIDPTGAKLPRELVGPGALGEAWSAAFDPLGVLYWTNGTTLRRALYQPTGSLTPETIGTITYLGGAVAVTGLAFGDGVLLGYRSVTLPGFYAIDVATGAASLLAQTPTGTDFGGFDFDAATGRLYGLNDGTGLAGRGLYQIDGLPGGTPSYTLLTPYPGTDTDIDGLAIGDGLAYLVNDVPGQGIYVYNLETGAFEPTLASPFTGANGIFSAGTFAGTPIPEPSSWVLLGLGTLGVLGRRWRGRRPA